VAAFGMQGGGSQDSPAAERPPPFPGGLPRLQSIGGHRRNRPAAGL